MAPMVFAQNASAPVYEAEEPKTVEEMIVETFGDDAELALKVAKAESGLNPTAVNPEPHRGCRGSYGVFQIACVHTDDTQKLLEPEENIRLAYALYSEQGWRPWGVCHEQNGVRKVKCW